MIRGFIRSRLLDVGLWIERSTSNNEVENLISQLRPMHTSCELKRFGPRGDGGYLLPNDLEGIGACVSPGVSFECGFDKDVADLGIDVYLVDASVSKPPIAHEKFRFTRKFFDIFTSDESITIDEFCKNISPGNDLLLQMDIEGAEYKVLKSASEELLTRFRIMVIEFHNLAHIFTKFGLREIASVFQKILKTHYVVHIHPNNTGQPVSRGSLVVPPLMEFTFYRKDRAIFERRALEFPNPLDVACVSGSPDLILPRCWY